MTFTKISRQEREHVTFREYQWQQNLYLHWIVSYKILISVVLQIFLSQWCEFWVYIQSSRKAPANMVYAMLIIMKTITFFIRPLHLNLYYVYAPWPPSGIGQSSSVILDQKTQTMTTAARVNSVSNKPPFILPCVALQIWTLITYWNIWPIAKSRAALPRYTVAHC